MLLQVRATRSRRRGLAMFYARTRPNDCRSEAAERIVKDDRSHAGDSRSR